MQGCWLTKGGEYGIDTYRLLQANKSPTLQLLKRRRCYMTKEEIIILVKFIELLYIKENEANCSATSGETQL